MKPFVFLGPTLPAAEAASILDAVYLPPVSQGDVFRVAREKPWAIAIIDGYFERVPAVWHKEILWALTQGIHVFGASSMGALRAAELAPYGMVGVGQVFHAFRQGEIEDDDEVTISHAPAEWHYRAVSEAMVNIRATVRQAASHGVIGSESANTLLQCAKRLHYPERTYPRILAGTAEAGASPAELARFERWLPAGRVDQKRRDALALLHRLRRRQKAGLRPFKPTFHFHATDAWEQVARRSGRQLAAAAGTDLPTEILWDELRLDGGWFERLKHDTLRRSLAIAESQRQRLQVTPAAFRETLHAFFAERGLLTPEQIQGWLQQEGLGQADLTRFIELETRVRWAEKLFTPESQDQLEHALRDAGIHRQTVERAQAKRRRLVAAGHDNPSIEDTGLNETELQEWFFIQQRGEPIPADLDVHARRLGCTNRHGFLQILIREYLFQKLNDNSSSEAAQRA